ncbi:MAG TPA: DUF6798 domain-containing protein, partial [Bryobacteraceae bacterium]
FPGHTFLGSDTQIYIPMLQHLWDPSSLARDLVATKPHLSFTLYDEITIALRWITHSSFKAVLIAQQLVFRACEILGVYLLAASFPLARRMAMLVAALFTLGATIVGPAVLTFEYEPVPRGFAIGLIFLAIGLAAQEHLMLADIAAAVAFLYHPPTVWAFWVLYLWLTLHKRDYRDLWPLAISIAVLFISSQFQPGVSDKQVFFTRVTPELEKLQRMRASYNWVSTWSYSSIAQYIFLWIVSLVAFWRVRPKAARLFLIGMPAIGLLSIPLSYLLLDELKWGLIPQFQPARATLFITAFAVIMTAAAGIRAAEGKQWIESVAWFAVAIAAPVSARLFSILSMPRQLVLTLIVAIALTGVVYLQRLPKTLPLLAGIALAPFFLLPGIGRVRNYSSVDLSGIESLARFTRASTSKDAVFLFGDAGTSPVPSIFRAESERAVYVDWKAGGQMNFNESLAREWWQRWQNTNALRWNAAEAERLPGLGIDYLVLSSAHALNNRQPVYQSNELIVYFVGAPTL